MQNKLIAHQILVQRFGSKLARDVLPFLIKMEQQTVNALSREGDTVKTRKRLNQLLVSTRKRIKRTIQNYDAATQKEFLAFIDEELDFNQSAFTGVDTVKPAPEQVLTAVNNAPMTLNNQAVSMAQAVRELEASAVRRINGAISAGFFQGLTTDQIAINVRNAINTTRNEAQTIVRTSVNFLSNEARQAFYKSNDNVVEGYIYTATLDSRTSDICKSLDGLKVRWEDSYQPQPPQHFNCRSTTRPLLNEKYDFLQEGATRASRGEKGPSQVPQNQTYYEWLKTQPAKFQDEALGPTRGKIFRNAGLTPEEFKKAATDRFNQPLTLEEMKRKSQEIDEYLT